MEREMTPTGIDTVARFPQQGLQNLSVSIGLKEAITCEQKAIDLLEKNIVNGATWRGGNHK